MVNDLGNASTTTEKVVQLLEEQLTYKKQQNKDLSKQIEAAMDKIAKELEKDYEKDDVKIIHEIFKKTLYNGAGDGGRTHTMSPPRDFEGGGDVAEYWGKESGKAVLTGNAWAVQENNTLKSKKITIFLADDKLQTKDEEK